MYERQSARFISSATSTASFPQNSLLHDASNYEALI
jgi:hypothetical protein